MGDEPEHEHQWGLVVPFTCVTSAGGPFDDLAFCAGFDAATRHAAMRLGPREPFTVAIRCELRAQMDLLAMEAGWTMAVEDDNSTPNDEWLTATFTPGEQVSDG